LLYGILLDFYSIASSTLRNETLFAELYLMSIKIFIIKVKVDVTYADLAATERMTAATSERNVNRTAEASLPALQLSVEHTDVHVVAVPVVVQPLVSPAVVRAHERAYVGVDPEIVTEVV